MAPKWGRANNLGVDSTSGPCCRHGTQTWLCSIASGLQLLPLTILVKCPFSAWFRNSFSSLHSSKSWYTNLHQSLIVLFFCRMFHVYSSCLRTHVYRFLSQALFNGGVSCGMIVSWVLVTAAQILVGSRFYRNAYKVRVRKPTLLWSLCIYFPRILLLLIFLVGK